MQCASGYNNGMDTFSNRVVLVTGASGGIGRELVRQLAALDAVIAAIDLDEKGLSLLQSLVAGRPFASAVGDVTDRESLFPAVQQLEKQLGPVDLLIANAGIGVETTASTFKAADVERQLQVNLVGVANSIEAVLPGMLQRRRGHIVGMSSLASYRGLPRMWGYCASKSGLNSMLEGLRVELRPHGISVTSICPGWIRTRLTEMVNVPKPYLMEPEMAVRRMVDAIRRRKNFIAFPAKAAWQVRVLRWLPAALSDRLIGFLLRRLSSSAE
jgi:NAD(P)-dependent dehydrogenase (short-subunit alcohol dehydrogenase family)